MKIAYVLFKGLTWLDFVGFYDPITRLKSLGYRADLSWDILSFFNEASDSFGLNMKIDSSKGSLNNYDVVFIPGGLGTRKLIKNKEFINWIKTINDNALKISVCTGSLILGAAGFLKDKKATTHFNEYDLLKEFCGEVVKDRIVEDDNVITAGAVSSSIDLGLYICRKWAGENAAEEIRKRMNYDK